MTESVISDAGMEIMSNPRNFISSQQLAQQQLHQAARQERAELKKLRKKECVNRHRSRARRMTGDDGASSIISRVPSIVNGISICGSSNTNSSSTALPWYL